MSKTLILLLLCTFTLLFSTFRISDAHNITSILAKYPKFLAFNRYLTATGLDEEINHGMGLTICAVDNLAMFQFIAKVRPSINTLRHILSLHVLQSYYDGMTLRHLPSSKDQVLTLFSDEYHLAFGYPRWVHITDTHDGKVVKFSVKDKKNKEKIASLMSSIEGIPPYNISVVQISGVLATARAKPDFHTVLTTVMNNNNFCRIFREKLSGTLAEKIYKENVDSGLTVFCPGDDSFRKFLPTFEKLSETDKNSLLLFHAMPVYMSLYMIREAKGIYETLATDQYNRYVLLVEDDGYGVNVLKTQVTETRMALRLLDDKPMAIYAVDDVLLPQELFNSLRLE